MWALPDEMDKLKEHIEEKETELMDMRVKVQGLERQVTSLEVGPRAHAKADASMRNNGARVLCQAENEALNQRVVDAVKLGGKIQEAQQGHSVDWIASEFEQAFDGMDSERRRKAKFLSDQERVRQACSMCAMSQCSLSRCG